MLETVREYGLERLEVSGMMEVTRDRHAQYFLRFAEAIKPELAGPRQQSTVARLETELANLRTALAWFYEQGRREEALRLAGALARFWYLCERYGEGHAHLEAGLALPGNVAPAVQAQALAGACQLADWLGNYHHAVTRGDAAVALWRSLGNQRELADALLVLSVALIQVDIARAEDVGVESLELFRVLGDNQRMAEALDVLGVAAYARGDYGTAAARMEQGLPLAREADDPAILGDLLGDLGHVSMVLGDHRRVKELIGEALAIHHAHDARYWIAWCLACLAGVASDSQPARAATMFGASAALREDVGAPLRPSVQAVYSPIIARTRATLGDAAFTEFWERGAVLSLDEAIAESLAIVDELAQSVLTDQPADSPFGLTPREAEVLRLVAAGQSNREIAAALFISVPTVKRHLSTILRKLDLPSRPAAVAFAHTHSLA
jgi:non-specific serine/threonine protein kinase